MIEGDILILEIRLQRNDSSDPGGDIELNKQFDFTPLYELGVTYDSDRMDYITENNRNQVNGTKTITAVYKDLEINEETIPEVKLSYTHEYQKDALIDAISKEGLSILDTFTYKTTMVIVLKK